MALSDLMPKPPARRAALLIATTLALGAACERLSPSSVGAPGPTPSPASAMVVGARPRAPAGAAELALVAPLAPGATLGAFRVREVLAVSEGSMRVVCESDASVVTLEIALDDEQQARPPASSGRYAIYYSGRRVLPDDAAALARALAEVVGKNASAPVPPGMSRYDATPKPGRAL